VYSVAELTVKSIQKADTSRGKGLAAAAATIACSVWESRQDRSPVDHRGDRNRFRRGD
jgi:hypothetical protein